ncbi:hypothetical protein [Ensifer aridi]|uniref:hypothetical protein n=1 Tax=Ensifer aridi TaxID=1708715 RepID=UPI0009BEAC9F|nr:hypothetical protein [Ensifer aridi]
MTDGAAIDRKTFYDECSRILGAPHVFRAPLRGKINRWNNRAPGNGRFPGYGLIRMYGSHHIQITLRRPAELNIVCHSKEEALTALRALRDSALSRTGH